MKYIGEVPGSPSALPLSRIRPGAIPEARLRRFLVCTVLFLTAGFTFLDYWAYSRIEHEDPVSWQLLAGGKGVAPAQYRIGVYYSANFFARLTHLHFRHLFAIADGFCVASSLAALFFLLTRAPQFQRSALPSKWSQVLLGLLFTQFCLSWALWFQEPETMPSLAILAAVAILSSGLLHMPRAMLVVSLLLLAALGSTIRVDAVIAIFTGLLLASMMPATGRADRKLFPIGRAWQAGISLGALGMAFSIEHFIARSLFPHAVRSVALFQLVHNLHQVNGTLVLLCTMPPWLLTVWLCQSQWSALNAWARGLLIGSVVHFGMFLVFGMSSEIRIFLPFMLTLMPVAMPLLCSWFQGEEWPGTPRSAPAL